LILIRSERAKESERGYLEEETEREREREREKEK